MRTMASKQGPRSAKPVAQPQDHRVRVAAQRREKMRARLMEAALVVFGQRGVEASIIDEITAIAGVSRGTFYNYFRTNEELLAAVSLAVGNEIVMAIMGRFKEEPDAAVRASVGIRSWLEVARRYPHVGAFFRRAGMFILDQNLRAREETRRYLPLGVKAGKFKVERPELAFDLMGGAVLAGINTIATMGTPKGYDEELTQRVLIGLGVDSDEAASLAFAPLEPLALSPESLIARSAAKVEELRARAD